MEELSSSEWCFLLDLLKGTPINDALTDHGDQGWRIDIKLLANKLEANWDETLGGTE